MTHSNPVVTASSNSSTPVTHAVSRGLWALAWRRLRADRVAMVSLTIVVAYLIMLILSVTGVIAKNWDQEVGVNYAPPTFIGAAKEDITESSEAKPAAALPENPVDPLSGVLKDLRGKDSAASAVTPEVFNDYGIKDPLQADMDEIRAKLATEGKKIAIVRKETLPFGADKWGHDIVDKTIKGSETSIVVGLIAALLAVALGTLFGAISGYFGGRVDAALEWFYNVFTSIPYLLLILAVAAVLQQKGILSIVLILALTGWTGTYRLIRAEYMKHKTREYVLAADAIGASHLSKMFSHIFPNVSHVALVQMSILVVSFIKSEVILSFLGFGVPVGVVSWGSMLNEAQNELILGKWWQLTAASVAMAVLVTAFSLFTDALRDALDPKLK
ncbi:ABC transporter permease [Aquirhabdus parva]|uniref:ABC transporter permease n=1 Tax=Aquirhabdus parva TaxID=2283318 RepID=A0A345P3N7_9GAMM|nr:ABC transporter permease [Aquirhabdus parva]AXI01896.1 ABC transporter permease [Aquirhabdus parva]